MSNFLFNIFNILEKIIRKIKNIFYFFLLKIKYGKRIKIGKNVKFRRKLIINIKKNAYLEIGDNCFFNSFCSINCQNKIIIGKNNLFGENVKIYDHYHIFNDLKINIKTTKYKNSIIIGDRNWFGSNCVILNKSQIGDNNVFQANLTINNTFKSGNIVKGVEKYSMKKIEFK